MADRAWAGPIFGRRNQFGSINQHLRIVAIAGVTRLAALADEGGVPLGQRKL
jgi:hypothetical protein